MIFTEIPFSYCIRKGVIAKLTGFGKHLITVNLFNVNFFKNLKTTLYSCNINMEDIYDPPRNIRGMKVLDRNIIKKAITVSCLSVDGAHIDNVVSIAKKYMLKIKGIKPVQSLEGNEQRILIDTKKINAWSDFDENTLEKFNNLGITEDNFLKVPLELKYENWLHHEILKAILPENEPPLTSFSVIGHIIHLNIKDHLLEYKNVIAEVLLDKISAVKTVVYKKSKIDNVYRNFEMEVLCGEPNFIACVKENQCNFKLDFSKVYWNPRLATEHMRIVEMLNEGDIVFDVFAGVGPFAIPAAKKKCCVFANDLNPESVKWLEHNISLNKKAKGYINVFNKDGSDFILTDVKENLIKTYQNEEFNGKIHFLMNLPGIAPKFIKHLKGLITDSDLIKFDVEKIKKFLPIIHCYFFTMQSESVQFRFEEDSEITLNEVEHSFYFVRKVSNSKSMHRITLTLPINYLMAGSEPLHKRIRTQ